MIKAHIAYEIVIAEEVTKTVVAELLLCVGKKQGIEAAIH